LVESNAIIVTISIAFETAEPVYKEPLACFTKEGNVTVPVPKDPWVIRIFTVCPGFMLVGLMLVPAPFTSDKVKKLFVDMLTDAVVEEIDNADTCPRREPVTCKVLVNLPDPVTSNEPVTVELFLAMTPLRAMNSFAMFI